MYLTYEEYQNMDGTLDETTFLDFEFEAESVVNWYTFNRLKNEIEYPEALTRLMYRLIQLLQARAEALNITDTNDSEQTSGNGRSIASQSNDGVSISYNIMSASELAEQCKNEMINIIKIYLSGVTNSLGRKLLYRGIYPGE